MVIGKVINSILQPSDIYKEIWNISVRLISSGFWILRVFIQENGLDKNLLEKQIKTEFSNTV
jgi:cell fate regulator YaaT (PSP1 superfamily)